MASKRLVVLFGYDSSCFTQKIRLVLRLKGIPYTYVQVPPMMPRPILSDNFNLTYRKIPVLTINRDMYIDTSIIAEALDHHFPHPHRSLYPPASDGRTHRSLIRGFASYWTDRPLFRITCGLMPASIWRTAFGKDRKELIGHEIDADKLERKIPENLALLDMQLSILQPVLAEAVPWVFATKEPSMADLALYYQLKWGREIARGYGVSNLTAGQARDDAMPGVESVLNKDRYPDIEAWYERVRQYMEGLPDVETRVSDAGTTLDEIRAAEEHPVPLLPTPVSVHEELRQITGLVEGAEVSVAPDDTGRANPTIGNLTKMTPEEVVILPKSLGNNNVIPVRMHFPRLGFVIRPTQPGKL